MIDKKLVIPKYKIENDEKIKKLVDELSFESYDHICNLVEEKVFENKMDKKDYYIIQFSFMIRNKDKKEIFICNREPLGFDGEGRITSGLSLLFSVSKTGNAVEDAIKNKIKDSMLFFDAKKKLIKSLNIEISEIGKGINRLNSGPTYIFFVYEVDISSNIFDIILSKHIANQTFDVDYIFKVNENFLNYTYESFMNESAHFDICLVKEGIAKKSQHKNALFIPNVNGSTKVFDLSYSDGDKKSLLRRIRKYINDNFGDIASDITLLQDETALPHIIDLVRCLWKMPVSILTINKNIIGF